MKLSAPAKFYTCLLTSFCLFPTLRQSIWCYLHINRTLLAPLESLDAFFFFFFFGIGNKVCLTLGVNLLRTSKSPIICHIYELTLIEAISFRQNICKNNNS